MDKKIENSKSNNLKRIIREAVSAEMVKQKLDIKKMMVEVINDHYKDVLVEALRGNKTPISETQYKPSPPSSSSKASAKGGGDYGSMFKDFMKQEKQPVVENNNYSVPKDFDTVNGELPDQDISLDQIMKFTKK